MSEEYKAVDKQGRPVKLSSYLKNKIYRECKSMRNDIKDSMCTRNECDNPSEYNINKMKKNEFGNKGNISLYKKLMGNIGADPKDYSTERLRRR